LWLVTAKNELTCCFTLREPHFGQLTRFFSCSLMVHVIVNFLLQF